MEIAFSMLIGYFFGSLSPSALISCIKKKNLRESGTGNLGAANTMLIFGKGYGILVMAVDMLKAYASVKLAEFLFPKAAIAGLLAGVGAVLGHIFPPLLKFKGGKGLAPFGGMILALDLRIFLILLLIGIIFALITDYAVAVTLSSAVMFPFIAGYRFQTIEAFALAFAVSILIIFKHRENIQRMKNGTEIKIRDYLKKR